jgi:multidrug resistance protein, MATE family
MIQTNSSREKIIQLLQILLPILITQLTMFSTNFFDTIMSGHFSRDDLAGVAIGSSLWVPVFTGLSGILLAVTPIVAQLVGSKKQEEATFSFLQGIYLSILIAVVVIIVGSFILDPVLNKMNLDTKVEQVAHDYLVALSLGMIPLFMYNVVRSFIDALGKTRTSMVITLFSLPINIVFNYLLIYGKYGFPKLGGVGAGYASAITYWCITILALLIVGKHKSFTSFQILNKFHPISLRKWLEILKIGVPIGLSIFFETSIFAAVTLLMSTFDTITIASHQSALNFASFLYMFPLSVSMALTIVVGFEVGAQRLQDAKIYSWIGVLFAVFISIVCGMVLFLVPTEIAGLYSDDPEVLKLTTQFLLYALFFQLSDAIAAPIQGALRGYKDVNITFLMSLISYWVIGLPLGYSLATYTNMGAFGYWVGLIVGLAVGALCLSYRLWHLQKTKLTF